MNDQATVFIAYGDSDRDGIANVYDRDSRYYDARVAPGGGF